MGQMRTVSACELAAMPGWVLFLCDYRNHFYGRGLLEHRFEQRAVMVNIHQKQFGRAYCLQND